MMELYPVKMKPAYKDYLWGGERLKKEWGKGDCPYDICAESWELSGHKNGLSYAENGSLEGKSLNEITEIWGKGCLGRRAKDSDRFPILIKLIDPKKKLSIQVHPDDSYAMKNEGEYGKTEMWYVADANEGSGLLCGFKRDITPAEYKKAIEENKLIELLNFVPVKKGDMLFISPGTVHAICEGTLICEIQQNSDITYRVYDYGRVGADGKPRQLHIEKALEVSRLKGESYDGAPCGKPKNMDGYTITELAACKYFTVNEVKIETEYKGNAGVESFEAATFIDGEGKIIYKGGSVPFKKGDTFFIPSGLGGYIIKGCSTVLISNI